MATANLTPDQQQLANMMAGYNYYLNQGSFTGANDPSGHYSEATPAASALGHSGPLKTADDALMNTILPGSSWLFGKKAKPAQWQPYVTEDNQYAWADPRNANTVPLSNIPGTTLAPSAEYQTMADQVRAVSDLLPFYSSAISAQKIPDAQGQLAADTATTGPRLALQQQLQEQYGPIFDQLAAESNMRKAMASANTDKAVLEGPGKDLVAAALAAAKQYDPEYYATRANTSDSIAALLGQTTANLGSGLSATERDEVDRGLALEGARRGTANAPSNLNTVENAMRFGAAGRARESENQNQLSKAIQMSTAFLPASRSNVDVFQVATGKPSVTQQDNRFNTNTATSDASGSAGGLLNTQSSMWNVNTNAKNAMALQNDQQNDWGNRLSQITGALGNMGGLMMGM